MINRALRWCCVVIAWAATAAAQPPGPGPSSPASIPPRVPGFGPLQGQRAVPGFGVDTLPQVTITPEDLARADERMQRYDTNHDGYVDRNEANNGRWYDEPFQFDTDRDGRLSRLELGRRYALRRFGDPGGMRGPPFGQGGPPGPNPSQDEQQRRERERRAMEEAARTRGGPGGTRESWHLAETLMVRHDADRDGFLDALERRSSGVAAAADTDRDQRINRPELAVWLAEQEASQGRAGAPELPVWFVEKDRNSDGQVQMSEFADEWSDERLDEFVALDANNDGIIVPEECLRALSRLQQEHSNQRFQLIPTRGVVRSEIDVADKSLIADVDVQLQITHTHDDHVNVFLLGPLGQRVELFTNIGGQDDHFDNTILDEESPKSIMRAAPPFSGRYQTEEASRGGKGLRQLYSQSMAGTWTLLVEANSDRIGVLHGWSLIFRRVEENPEPGQGPEKEFD